MAGKSLAVNVTVGGETFLAGSTPPKEIADQITNPKAWDSAAAETVSGGADESARPAKRAASKPSAK